MIYFTDTSNDSDGYIVNWTWDFGDGNTSYGDRSLSFDGVDDYVDCGNDPSLDLVDEFTVEAWIKPVDYGPSQPGKYHGIVTKGTTSPWSNGGAFGLELHTAGKMYFFARNSSNTGYSYAGPSYILTKNTWYHVVGQFDTGTYRLYINGQLVDDTVVGWTSVNMNSQNLRIGALNEYFNGTIDDVRIYSRALNSSEILDNFDGSVSTSGLVSWWKMNDTDDIAYDSIGGNDGAIYGAVWTNNADHRYASDGTYQVNLTVMDNEDTTDSISKPITVSG